MALRSLRVIEFAGLAPGPFCGMILADFGASVTRIDPIDGDDSMDILSNGKKSLSVNIKTASGKEIIRKLSSNCDVLIEPFRKGVMERNNLGPEQLLKINPRLIYARLSGYGQDGYYSNMAGHDINYLGLTGLLSMYGWRGELPSPPLNFSEFAGGSVICVMGILMAIIERYQSGVGQVIDANILEGVAYVGSWLMRGQQLSIFGQSRGKNWLDGGTHFYDTYKTKDGKHMAVGALEPKFYMKMLDLLQLSYQQLPQSGDFYECRKILEKKFKEKSQAEWCKIFDGSDACVTPILPLNEVMHHPHNKERKSFISGEDNVIIPKPAPRMSVSMGKSAALKPRPHIGQHSYEILLELGYDKQAIEKLESDRVVYVNKKSKL